MKIKLLIAFCLPLAVACTEKPDETPAAAVNAAQQPAALSRSASAEDARVFFISPADGDTVNSPIRVVFGTEGMAVVPAGNDTPHSGHHHLLIDTELPELGLPIPKDEHHVHFGDGSTETEIMLEPGEHTLQLLLGDHLHIPHDPPLNSGRIKVTVK
jgi:hypothetical protein